MLLSYFGGADSAAAVLEVPGFLVPAGPAGSAGARKGTLLFVSIPARDLWETLAAWFVGADVPAGADAPTNLRAAVASSAILCTALEPSPILAACYLPGLCCCFRRVGGKTASDCSSVVRCRQVA
jgi:hypothetical protein